MNKFKTKKKHSIIKSLILFGCSLIVTLVVGLKLISKLTKNEETKNIIINYLLGKNDIELSSSSINSFLLKYALGFTKEDSALVSSEINDDDIEGPYVEDPLPSDVLEPIIYIYNTHQTEAYQKDYLEPYSIKPTIMLASYMLREYLNDLGIPTIMETNEVKKILNNNNWSYGHSYLVTRDFIKEAKKNNPSLKIFIDLHRDSSSYDKTTTTIDGEKYARILFVVGLEHENKDKILAKTIEFNDFIKEKYASISRGIMKKSGPGVNGVYNQDLNDNSFLIEVGGQYNNIEEVKNTMELLAKIIFDYMGVYYD